MDRRTIFSVSLCFLQAVALPEAASGQTLELAPITVDIATNRLQSIIQVTNRGDEPTTVQVRPYQWRQTDGADKLDPTAELLVSPPISTIGPGETQTVRLVLRKAAGQCEAAYRLLVDQLPPAAAPGSVRLALRISLPVFAAPAAPAALARPRLRWNYRSSDDRHGVLTITNDGSRHVRISGLTLTSPDGSTKAPGFSFGYILANSTIAVPIGVELASGRKMIDRLRISAMSDQGRIDADATLAPAA